MALWALYEWQAFESLKPLYLINTAVGKFGRGWKLKDYCFTTKNDYDWWKLANFGCRCFQQIVLQLNRELWVQGVAFHISPPCTYVTGTDPFLKVWFHHSQWAGRSSAIPREAKIHCTQQWPGKTNGITLNIHLFLLLPQLYMLAWYIYMCV